MQFSIIPRTLLFGKGLTTQQQMPLAGSKLHQQENKEFIIFRIKILYKTFLFKMSLLIEVILISK